jgi:hypothetical protein
METSTDDVIFEMAEVTSLLAVKNPDWECLHSFFLQQAQSLEHNGWKKRNGMTQHDKILKHMRTAGSISVREAMNDYSIHKLATRISELRSAGHSIEHKVQHHPVTGQKYYRYSLAV